MCPINQSQITNLSDIVPAPRGTTLDHFSPLTALARVVLLLQLNTGVSAPASVPAELDPVVRQVLGQEKRGDARPSRADASKSGFRGTLTKCALLTVSARERRTAIRPTSLSLARMLISKAMGWSLVAVNPVGSRATPEDTVAARWQDDHDYFCRDC